MLPPGHGNGDNDIPATPLERSPRPELSAEEQSFLAYLAELVAAPAQLRSDPRVAGEHEHA